MLFNTEYYKRFYIFIIALCYNFAIFLEKEMVMAATATINLRVTPDVKEMVQMMADRIGVSINSFATMLFKQAARKKQLIIDTVDENGLTAEEAESLRTGLADLTLGHTDGPFDGEGLTAYLDSLKGRQNETI
jgi:antitoxin component of RelBE/YafQ-DinJ toxin-antitoxin module